LLATVALLSLISPLFVAFLSLISLLFRRCSAAVIRLFLPLLFAGKRHDSKELQIRDEILLRPEQRPEQPSARRFGLRFPPETGAGLRNRARRFLFLSRHLCARRVHNRGARLSARVHMRSVSCALLLVALLVAAPALAQQEPPARVGRVASV
jgi:hypothetical protein